MPKVLISDSLSNLANNVFAQNNIDVDTIKSVEEEVDETKTTNRIFRGWFNLYYENKKFYER